MLLESNVSRLKPRVSMSIRRCEPKKVNEHVNPHWQVCYDVSMKKQISTKDAPDANHVLSQAIEANGFIFVSGQIHILPDNTLVDGSTKDKVTQIFKNIEAILLASDSSLNAIVKVVVYVTDMALMPELNEIYPTFFAEPYPVREAVCVTSLPLGADIEISVVAAK